MNKFLRELAEQATLNKLVTGDDFSDSVQPVFDKDVFAYSIVQEVRDMLLTTYLKTPLELCGPLLTLDEEITTKFYRE